MPIFGANLRGSVRKANVILRGLGGAASNTTDINGISVLTTPDTALVRLEP